MEESKHLKQESESVWYTKYHLCDILSNKAHRCDSKKSLVERIDIALAIIQLIKPYDKPLHEADHDFHVSDIDVNSIRINKKEQGKNSQFTAFWHIVPNKKYMPLKEVLQQLFLFTPSITNKETLSKDIELTNEALDELFYLLYTKASLTQIERRLRILKNSVLLKKVESPAFPLPAERSLSKIFENCNVYEEARILKANFSFLENNKVKKDVEYEYEGKKYKSKCDVKVVLVSTTALLKKGLLKLNGNYQVNFRKVEAYSAFYSRNGENDQIKEIYVIDRPLCKINGKWCVRDPKFIYYGRKTGFDKQSKNENKNSKGDKNKKQSYRSVVAKLFTEIETGKGVVVKSNVIVHSNNEEIRHLREAVNNERVYGEDYSGFVRRGTIKVEDAAGKTVATKCSTFSPYFKGRTFESFISDNLSLENKISLGNSIGLEIKKLQEEAGLIHLDIKPSNVIIDVDKNNSFDSKLIDFEGAQSIHKTTLQHVISTRLYVAPEVTQKRAYSASDIYSFGILLFQLFFKLSSARLHSISNTLFVNKRALRREIHAYINQSNNPEEKARLLYIQWFLFQMIASDPAVRPSLDIIENFFSLISDTEKLRNLRPYKQIITYKASLDIREQFSEKTPLDKKYKEVMSKIIELNCLYIFKNSTKFPKSRDIMADIVTNMELLLNDPDNSDSFYKLIENLKSLKERRCESDKPLLRSLSEFCSLVAKNKLKNELKKKPENMKGPEGNLYYSVQAMRLEINKQYKAENTLEENIYLTELAYETSCVYKNQTPSVRFGNLTSKENLPNHSKRWAKMLGIGAVVLGALCLLVGMVLCVTLFASPLGIGKLTIGAGLIGYGGKTLLSISAASVSAKARIVSVPIIASLAAFSGGYKLTHFGSHNLYKAAQDVTNAVNKIPSNR